MPAFSIHWGLLCHFLLDRISCRLGWPQPYLPEDDFSLSFSYLHLPRPAVTGLGYHTQFCPVLHGKPRASCLPGKRSAPLTDSHPWAFLFWPRKRNRYTPTHTFSFYPSRQFRFFFFLPFPVPIRALSVHDCVSCRAWLSWPWEVRSITSGWNGSWQIGDT